MALDNLRLAREAGDYVRNVVKVKAANRSSDGIDQQQFNVALAVQNGIEDNLATSIADEALLALVASAKAAVQTRIGNCLSMASLAAAYLAAKGRFPLHVMSFTGGDSLTPRIGNTPITGTVIGPNAFTNQLIPGRTGKGGNADYQKVPKFEPDHTVCVIGHISGTLSNRTWGQDTVFCDPWARRYYFATELAEESRLIAMVTGGFAELSINASLSSSTDWNSSWSKEIGLT